MMKTLKPMKYKGYREKSKKLFILYKFCKTRKKNVDMV